MSIKNNLCISVISSVVAILLLFYTLVVIFNLSIDNIQQYQYNLHIASSFLMNLEYHAFKKIFMSIIIIIIMDNVCIVKVS